MRSDSKRNRAIRRSRRSRGPGVGRVFLLGAMLFLLQAGGGAGWAQEENSGGGKSFWPGLVGKGLFYNPLTEGFTRPLMEELPGLSLRGMYSLETDLRLHNKYDGHRNIERLPGRYKENPIPRIEHFIFLKERYQFSPRISLWAEQHFLYDAAFDWVGSNSQAGERELELYHKFRQWFRELWLNLDLGGGSLRLGKKQVVWGKATDVARILDWVSGFDLRELNDGFSDSELIRHTVWMAEVNYAFGELFDVQLLWLPDFQPNEFPPAGYIQSPFSVSYPDPLRVRFLSRDKPSAAFRNHEWGVRLSSSFRGYDLVLNYLYLWNRNPTFFQRGTEKVEVRDPRTGTSKELDRVILEPRYTRIHLLGGSVEKTFTISEDNDWIFRFEAGLTLNDYQETRNEPALRQGRFTGLDGFAKVNRLTWAASLETQVGSEAGRLLQEGSTFTLWLIGFHTFPFDNDFTKGRRGLGSRDRYAPLVALNLPFDRKRGALSLNAAYMTGGSWRFHPTLKYQLNDDLSLLVGLTSFSGNDNDTWGECDFRCEEIELELNYNF